MQNTIHRYFELPANGLEEPAPQDMQDRLALAFADHQVRGLAQKTAFRIAELSRKAALDHVVRQALESADPAAGNDGILAALEKAFADVSQELAEWNSAAQIAQQRAKYRVEQGRGLRARAIALVVKKKSEISWVERQMASAGIRTSEKAEKYRKVGISEDELDKLGVLPPPVDVEKLNRKWNIHSADIATLERFISDPLLRVSVLGDIDLDASDESDIQRVDELAETGAKQAIAANEKKRTRKQIEAARVAAELAAEKKAADNLLVDRAIRIEAAKQREINALRGKITKAQCRDSLNPELMAWRQLVEALTKDISALHDFCGDYPHYRIEKANGLLGDAA